MSNVSPTASAQASLEERDLPEIAAEQSRVVTIPAEDWEKFEAWARAPAKTIPALRELASSRPVWQD